MKSCTNCAHAEVCLVRDGIERALSSGYASFSKPAVFMAVANECMAYMEKN